MKQKEQKEKPVKAWGIKMKNGQLWPETWKLKKQAWEAAVFCGDKVVKVEIREA